MLNFILNKLTSLGGKLFPFDKSLEEYQESLDCAKKIKDPNGFYLMNNNYQPWIWKELISNPSKYRNNFELCIEIHKISPKNTFSDEELFTTIDFKNFFGNYLANNIDNLDEFKILEEFAIDDRFQKIKL